MHSVFQEMTDFHFFFLGVKLICIKFEKIQHVLNTEFEKQRFVKCVFKHGWLEVGLESLELIDD